MIRVFFAILLAISSLGCSTLPPNTLSRADLARDRIRTRIVREEVEKFQRTGLPLNKKGVGQILGVVNQRLESLGITSGGVYSGAGTSSATYTVTDALIVGAATTSGVRLDLESGTLAVREGDDSAYAPLRVFSLGVGATPSASIGDINCTQITASSWINGAGTGSFLGPLLYQGSYTSSQSASHASSGRVIHNASASGDIEITLPAMAGKGSFFVVFVGSAHYLRITANAADKIRNGATASASGGYIRSNTVGSAMLLVGTGTSDWSVIGPTGTWTIDS